MIEGPGALWIAFVVPLAAALALTPPIRRAAVALGCLDRPAQYKFHRRATPYLGGVAVAAGVVGVGVFAAVAAASVRMLVVLLAATAAGVMGLIDDRRPVRPHTKLAVQAAGALALWAGGLRAGFFHVEALDLALTVLWVLSITNALNLLDNMDGLAGGVAAIAALCFALIAIHTGDWPAAALGLAVAGGGLGFLRYNFPPARIFLGDAGTMFLGVVIASLGLRLGLVGQRGVAMTAVALLALAVPLIDTLFVVLTRLRNGRIVWAGGTDHTSHLLSTMGFGPRRVALIFYAVQAWLCAIALWMVEAGPAPGPVVGAAGSTAAIGWTLWVLARRVDLARRARASAPRSVLGAWRDEASSQRRPAGIDPLAGTQLGQNVLPVGLEGLRGDG